MLSDGRTSRARLSNARVQASRHQLIKGGFYLMHIHGYINSSVEDDILMSGCDCKSSDVRVVGAFPIWYCRLAATLNLKLQGIIPPWNSSTNCTHGLHAPLAGIVRVQSFAGFKLIASHGLHPKSPGSPYARCY